MVSDVFLADLLDDIVCTPEFAVNEHNAFCLLLRAECAVCDHFLIQAVTHLRLVIVAAVAQHQLVKGVDHLALDICQLAVEEIVFHFAGAVIQTRIELKALLCSRTRCRAVHPDADIRIIGRLTVLEHGDIRRPLPFLAGLRIVCRLFPRLQHTVSRRIVPPVLIDLAADIDALFVIEQIIRIGDERDHAHIHHIIALRIADEIGLRDDLTDIAVRIGSRRTDDHCLIDRIRRRSVTIRNIRDRCIHIRFG